MYHGQMPCPQPVRDAPADPEPTPAPAPGPSDSGLDLNEELIPHPGHTVLLRVCGDSMLGAGIRPGDLLVVDRQGAPRTGQIVVALLAEGFTLKRLARRRRRWWLEAANPAYPPLALSGGDARLWGVALHVIRSLPGSRWPAPRS
jgi:DNA polymerase V